MSERVETRPEPGSLEVWFVRHGQTVANAQEQLSGWRDVALTEKGRSQATAAAAWLEDTRFDGIWSSDLTRAVMTAELLGVEPVQDPRLREMNFGDLEGVCWWDIDVALRDALIAGASFDPPGGETYRGFTERVVGFLDGLPPGRHLCVSHGGVIRALSQPLGFDGYLQNGELMVLDWTTRRVVEVFRHTEAPPHRDPMKRSDGE